MRSAGCIFNDIVDRKLDAKVERTKNRPLANKSMRVSEALILLFFLLLLSLIILINFNSLTIFLGLSSVLLVIIYPFMKRVTYWPQLFLGFTFNWGIILGWASVANQLHLETYILYIASIFWTLGYDTVYRYQDINDDERIGIKSTSRLFGKNSKNILWLFYCCQFLLMLILLILMKVNLFSMTFFFITILLTYVFLLKLDIKDPNSCRKFFIHNQSIGFMICICLLLSIV